MPESKVSLAMIKGFLAAEVVYKLFLAAAVKSSVVVWAFTEEALQKTMKGSSNGKQLNRTFLKPRKFTCYRSHFWPPNQALYSFGWTPAIFIFSVSVHIRYNRISIPCTNVLVCSGYENIRRDLDLNTMDGLIEYYKEVMNIRFSKWRGRWPWW